MSRINNKLNILTRNILISLCMTLVLTAFSTGLAQVSIVEELVDFVKNTNIEFSINNNAVGQQIPIYAENQDVGFSIVSQTSGYHYLYLVTGEGSSSLIYPNQFETEAFIQAGVQTNFPSSNAYRLIAQRGQGSDFHIVSIVSPTPLTGFTIGFTNGFNIIPPATQVIPGYQAAAMRYRVQESSQTAANCASNCLYLTAAPVVAQTPVYNPTTPATTTNTTNTAATGAYGGYATYEEYLDNFYGGTGNSASTTQTATQITTAQPTYTPTVTPVPVTTTPVSNYSVPNYATNAGTFQGFASYQAYLDNYYAQNGASQTTGSQTATQANTANTFAAVTPVTVYTSQVGANAAVNTTVNTAINTTVNTATTSVGAFQGFASYQEYLDNYYAQGSSLNTSTQTQQPTSTDPFQGFGSYDAYLANFQATNGTVTNQNNYSVYNVVPTQTTQAPNYSVDYSITQQQVPNNATIFTNLNPQTPFYPITPPQPATPPVVENQGDFFDFEVGSSYSPVQGLIVTVLSIQDNRCPANVQCVQAGNITATVELQSASVQRSFQITILPGEEPSIVVGDTNLSFIGLSNYSPTALTVNVTTQ